MKPLQAPGQDSSPFRREGLLVVLYALCAGVEVAHFVHTGWFLTTGGGAAPVPPAGYAPPVIYAPGAYRVAVPALLRLVTRIFRLKDAFLANAAVDLSCTFVSILLLYGILIRTEDPSPARGRTRTAAVLLLLAFTQFPLSWVVPWQRPETLPTALYIAFACYCLVRGREHAGWAVALVAATVWQGFVRSDVPIMLGVALALLSLPATGLRQLGSRPLNLARAAGIIVAGAGVQAFMQFVLFPHLRYPPGTGVLQWRDNLTFHNLESAIVALAPFLLFGGFLLIRRPRLEAIDAVIMAASAIYLPVWYLVGNIAEVRIYVPFMLAMCVVAARVLARWIAGESQLEPPV